VALVELPPINLEGKERERVLSRRDEGDDIRLLVEENDICTSLEESVGGRETGETTTNDDNASHRGQDRRERWWFVGRRKSVGSRSEAQVPAPMTVTRIRLHVFFCPAPWGRRSRTKRERRRPKYPGG